MAPLVITRWTSQAGRRRVALEPGYVKIDERTFPDLLAFAPRFAKQVRYFDLDDTPDGHWSDFFRADIAMVLAAIVTFDATGRSKEFRRLRLRAQHETSDVRKLDLLEQLFDTILALAREVDGWLATVEYLEPSTVTASVRRLLASRIRHELAPLLERLRAHGAGQPGALGRPVHLDCGHFQQVWRIGEICPDGSIYRGHLRRQKIDAAIASLDSLFDTFLSAVADLARRAQGEFDACLDEPHHKPHIALFMAFAKQFATAQERINDLPSRLVDFYYRELLHEPLRRPAPDRMFLCFTLAPRPGVDEAVVPLGTRFPAGADEKGHPILFAAERTLKVTPATLVRVRTLRAIRGPLYDDIVPDPLPDVGRARLQRIIVAETAVGPGGVLADEASQGWPIFGAPAAETAGKILATPAALGFAVASRSLLLTGGHRSVTIALWSDAKVRQSVLDPLLRHISAATGLAADLALGRLLEQAFGLWVTTEKEWQQVAAFNVEVAPGAMGQWSISFRFDLPPTAPPIVALDPLRERAPSDPAPDPDLPALMARLRQDPVTLSGAGGTVKVYPLSLLEWLPIENVTIEASVKNLPGLRITTSTGIVDAAAPFVPFGSPARVDAWFDIRHPELFTKTLHRLTVTIQWLGLPTHPSGFAGYYEQYVIGTDREPISQPIDNRSFRAMFSVRGDLPWALPLPAESGASVYLFRTDPPGNMPNAWGRLVPTTSLTFEIPPISDTRPREPLAAALRLTLSEPAFGFGDELYPPNVLNAVQPPAPAVEPPRKCWFCKLLGLIGLFPAPVEALPPPDLAHAYPNPPWQPQIAGLSVDYDATDRHADRTGQFMHLLPSGALASVAQGPDDIVTLLPTSAALTHFDLGFGGLGAAQPLTLLFRMANESAASNDACRVAWRHRVAGEWVDLPHNAVRHDGTNALSRSGIVSFDLPPLTPGATDSRLCWLRVEPRSDPEGFPSVLAVTPHALSATRLVDREETLIPIPAKTVKAAVPMLREIAAIDQPLASFGGEIAESAAVLPIRLGERLRHKERACQGWDYERLVLERFPEIAKIRVLGARGVARTRNPGEVLVVVVPGPAGVDASESLVPRAGVDTRARIQANLQGAANPFARILVVDPIYVRIAARVHVVFRTTDGNASLRLNDDLCEFLSPCSGGLDLPDDAGRPEIRTAIVGFIESRPYVASMVGLELSYTPDLSSAHWCVPTSAARHDIVAVAETAGLGGCVPAVAESAYA
ncbi:MAG: hypothetical protein QOF14_5490 [Hyphomicrobiales bacterium]|jgi:hypothetical protein|nr:hypothetical protein [Hyphomicrobiales bacterium]